MINLIAGFLSGLIGAMGLGGGGVLLIYLTLLGGVEQLRAQGINLLFFIPIGLVSVAIYAFKKQINWKTVLLFALSGLAGAAAGVWLSGIVGGKLVGKIFGGLLILMGITQIVSAFKQKKKQKEDGSNS